MARAIGSKNVERGGPGAPTFSEAEWRDIFRRRAARGGLSIAEQRVVLRMRTAGSGWPTIRAELGGRYTTEQIQQAAGEE